MRPPNLVFTLADSIVMRRHGLDFTATRRDLFAAESSNGLIRLHDVGIEESVTPFPCRPGRYRVAAYIWAHPIAGDIVVAVVIVHEDIRGGAVSECEIRQDYAAHCQGIPIDDAKMVIAIGGERAVVESGFGDGAYPVYQQRIGRNLPHALMVDFRIWQVRKVFFSKDSSWAFDRYAVVVDRKQLEAAAEPSLAPEQIAWTPRPTSRDVSESNDDRPLWAMIVDHPIIYGACLVLMIMLSVNAPRPWSWWRIVVLLLVTVAFLVRCWNHYWPNNPYQRWLRSDDDEDEKP